MANCSRGGAEIYEYQPAMIHAKVLVIDGVWSVVGSTNFDNRSFGLNDEVNLAAHVPAAGGARLNEDFLRDLQASHPITWNEWRTRPLSERIIETVGSRDRAPAMNPLRNHVNKIPKKWHALPASTNRCQIA